MYVSTVVNKKAVLSQGNRAMPRVVYTPTLFHLEFQRDPITADRCASSSPDSKDSRLIFMK